MKRQMKFQILKEGIVMDQQLWEKAIAFHGHACPGLAIGVRAATEAIKRLNLSFSEDEEVVCVTENDACGVDGIQAILSCTAGQGKWHSLFLTVKMDKKFVCV